MYSISSLNKNENISYIPKVPYNIQKIQFHTLSPKNKIQELNKHYISSLIWENLIKFHQFYSDWKEYMNKFYQSVPWRQINTLITENLGSHQLTVTLLCFINMPLRYQLLHSGDWYILTGILQQKSEATSGHYVAFTMNI